MPAADTGVTPNNVTDVPSLVEQLYEGVGRLEELFPDRSFTLDGQLVGSIGEVLAAQQFGLTLLPMTVSSHDAITKDRRTVQLRDKPDYLLVLFAGPDGRVAKVYNGPRDAPWHAAGKME